VGVRPVLLVLHDLHHVGHRVREADVVVEVLSPRRGTSLQRRRVAPSATPRWVGGLRRKLTYRRLGDRRWDELAKLEGCRCWSPKLSQDCLREPMPSWSSITFLFLMDRFLFVFLRANVAKELSSWACESWASWPPISGAPSKLIEPVRLPPKWPAISNRQSKNDAFCHSTNFSFNQFYSNRPQSFLSLLLFFKSISSLFVITKKSISNERYCTSAS
jgi:hypothetical protein